MVDEIAGRARRLSEEGGTNGPRSVAGSNGSPTISDSVLALATASTSAKQARAILAILNWTRQLCGCCGAHRRPRRTF
jgi:hypothetical protein